MTDQPSPDERLALLRRINTKLAWIIFFLVLITLNTCELTDDLEDAVRREAHAAARTQGNS